MKIVDLRANAAICLTAILWRAARWLESRGGRAFF